MQDNSNNYLSTKVRETIDERKSSTNDLLISRKLSFISQKEEKEKEKEIVK